MKSKKRSVFIVCLLFLLSSIWNPSTASAEVVMRVDSPSDSYNPPGLSASYDITSIETAIESDDPDKIYFWIKFKNPIKATQFVHGTKEPWAAIFLYRDEPDSRGGNFDDIRIETNKTIAFSGNYSLVAEAHGNEYSGDDRYELSDCNAQVWTNLDTAANWIGFSISRSCANIPNEFWISAYTDPDDNNSTTIKDFDWAPDEAWYVDISEADYIDSGESMELEPQTITFYQSPDVALSKKVAYLRAFSDSALDIEFTTSTPKVCVPLNWSSTIRLISAGTCKIIADQSGDEFYYAADSVAMSFKVTKVAVKSKVVAKPAPVPAPTKKAPGSIGGKPKN
jgi:hypothetical protein